MDEERAFVKAFVTRNRQPRLLTMQADPEHGRDGLIRKLEKGSHILDPRYAEPESVIGFSSPVISCIPGRLGYFEGQEAHDRFISIGAHTRAAGGPLQDRSGSRTATLRK